MSIILLVFSINVFAYYKYTQESGTNFYGGGTADKAETIRAQVLPYNKGYAILADITRPLRIEFIGVYQCLKHFSFL